MRRIPNISIRALLLFAIVSVPMTPSVHGDSWSVPRTATVTSPSGKFMAQVTPGSSGYHNYAHALTNREQNASAIVSKCQEGGTTNVIWEGKLINPVAPAKVLVSDAGHLVTLDNWHNLGGGPVVAIYDPNGHLLRHWQLDELFPPAERRRLLRSVSSTRWRAGTARFGAARETDTVLVPAVGKSLQFALTDGALLLPSDTRTTTEPDAAPEPPPADAVSWSSENTDTKPESEAPAESGGR